MKPVDKTTCQTDRLLQIMAEITSELRPPTIRPLLGRILDGLIRQVSLYIYIYVKRERERERERGRGCKRYE